MKLKLIDEKGKETEYSEFALIAKVEQGYAMMTNFKGNAICHLNWINAVRTLADKIEKKLVESMAETLKALAGGKEN